MTTTEQQAQFLDYVFGKDEGYICISTRIPGKPTSFTDHFFQWPKNKSQALAYIAKQSKNHDVWFGVNLLSAPKRNKEYCVPQNLLWGDLDAADPNTVTPKPQCVIESSPSRFQAIWRIDEKLDPYEAEKYSKQIAYAYRQNGADISGWDLTQLLRVPGTTNFKYGDKPKVELRHAYNTLAPLVALNGLPPIPEGEGEYDLNIPDDIPEYTDVLRRFWTKLSRTQFITLYEEEPDHDWSRALWRLINICLECDMSKKETFAVALEAKCNKYARDGRPVSHLWREVQRAAESQDKINKMVGTHAPLKIPELLTSDEIANLPGTLVSEYKDWAVASTDAIADYHDLTFFVVLSSLVAGGLVVNTTYGTVHPHLWGLVLGDSTLSRKTTAMKMGMSFVEEIDKDRVLATDASAEGMLSGLSGRPGQVSIFFRDEVSGFFDSINRKDYLAGMPELMTQLYDVPSVLTRRLKKETITVSSPVFVFFGGGIRDRTYSLINEQMVMSGFLPRFLTVSGDADLKAIRRTGPAIKTNIDKRTEISQRLHRLYEIYNAQGEIVLAGQKSVAALPVQIEALLSDEAWQRYGDIEMAMVEAANDSIISHLALPTYERLSRSLLKMSLLVAALNREPEDSILEVHETDVMIAASYIQKWLPHSVDLISNCGRTTTQRLLDSVLAGIRKEPGVLRGKLMQHHHLSRREMDDVQNTLEDRGQIRVDRKGKAIFLFPLD